MLSQSKGNYIEALQSYYEATQLEIGFYDRSYMLYRIGLHTSIRAEHDPKQKSTGSHATTVTFIYIGPIRYIILYYIIIIRNLFNGTDVYLLQFVQGHDDKGRFLLPLLKVLGHETCILFKQ